MAYAANQLPSGLDAKVTPIDADVLVAGDSADSNRAKKVTWANIKATLKTYFDTLYPSGSGTSTGSNTGDQTSIVGITGTKAQFDTAVTDGNFLYVGDVTTNATHTGEVTGSGELTIDKTAITGKTEVTAVGADYLLISDTSDTGNLKKALASDLIGSGGSPEGTAVLSTGEVGGTKFLREDGDGTCSWQTVPAGSGDVSKVGTPANNQVGVWTGDGTIEGDAALTFDTATDLLTTGILNSTSLTASEIVLTDASKNLVSAAVATYPSLTELSYVKGVTSALQTQINAKGTGDVTKVGTPADNQVGVWTGDGTVEGTAGLTFSANVLGVGTGATGTVQSNGNQDLILKTGNATSGSITIADGASGAINISPDANGHVYIDINGPTGKLQVGNGSGNGYITSQGTQNLVLATNGGTNSGLITITGGANGNISIAPNGTGAVVFSSTVEMGGNVSLGENASIDLDPALSADGKYSGTCITGTAGATLAFGDVVYLAAADSRWELTDADAVGTAGTVLVGICVLAAAGDGSATKVLLHGTIRADAKFPTLTISAPVYIDTTTAGGVTVTAPSGADDVVRVLGFALTADSMYFNPSQDHITHTG